MRNGFKVKIDELDSRLDSYSASHMNTKIRTLSLDTGTCKAVCSFFDTLYTYPKQMGGGATCTESIPPPANATHTIV